MLTKDASDADIITWARREFGLEPCRPVKVPLLDKSPETAYSASNVPADDIYGYLATVTMDAGGKITVKRP